MEYEKMVKTATGKEFEVRFMGSTSFGVTSVLYIELINVSISEAVIVFSDVNETYHLEGYVSGVKAKDYNGYTNLIEAIVLAETQNVRIALTAPIDEL